MADFMLEPDEIEPEKPERLGRARPVRIVSTGLAPTADMPTGKRSTSAAPPAYGPCPQCGMEVLRGHTPRGQAVTVEPGRACYSVVWESSAPAPVLHASRAYPVHQCLERKE